MDARGYRVRRSGGVGPPLRVIGQGRFRIGRDPRCELPIDDATVSRLHAEIEVLADGGALLVDIGSLNGCFVGGQRVSRCALSGDFDLRVGAVELLFDACWVRGSPLAPALPKTRTTTKEQTTGPIAAVPAQAAERA